MILIILKNYALLLMILLTLNPEHQKTIPTLQDPSEDRERIFSEHLEMRARILNVSGSLFTH